MPEEPHPEAVVDSRQVSLVVPPLFVLALLPKAMAIAGVFLLLHVGCVAFAPFRKLYNLAPIR